MSEWQRTFVTKHREEIYERALREIAEQCDHYGADAVGHIERIARAALAASPVSEEQP